MKKLMTILAVLIVMALVLVGCGGGGNNGETNEEPANNTAAENNAAAEENTAAENDAAAEDTTSDKVQIRWFVGLGTGTNPEQVAIQEEVVADFNASQSEIELVLEIVPYDSARDTLATQIASGSGPDIVGPVGWGGSNAFYGQWLDVAPCPIVAIDDWSTDALRLWPELSDAVLAEVAG